MAPKKKTATKKTATKRAPAKYKQDLKAFNAAKRAAAMQRGPRDATTTQHLIHDAASLIAVGNNAAAIAKLTEARDVLIRMDARTGRRDPSARHPANTGGRPALVAESYADKGEGDEA